VGVKSTAKKRSPRIRAIESAGWSIDGVIKAETSTLGSWFGVLSLEASVQVKTYDCVIELFGATAAPPFEFHSKDVLYAQLQAEVLRRCVNLETET